MTTDRPADNGPADQPPVEAPAGRRAPSVTAEERRLSRAESAYLDIADRLADLRFPPGSRFTESEVASELGMSKTPVREALLMHSAGGLIMTRPGAGYIVMPITLKDVRALLAHWRRLAADAVVVAVKRGIDSHAMVHLRDSLDDPSTIESNRAVFDFIFGVAEDTYLGRGYYHLSIEIERLLRLVLPEGDAALDQGLTRLVDIMATDDTKAARAQVLSHIDRVEELVLGELLSGDLLLTATVPAPGGRAKR